MIEAELAEVTARLARHPEDREAWALWGRLAPRAGEVVEPPVDPALRRGFLAAWAEDPAGRELEGALEVLLGVEVLGPDFHEESGLPRGLRRRADGAELRLVCGPGGAPVFYLDRFPVTVARYRSRVATGDPARPNRWIQQLQRPERPVVMLGHAEAAAYAASVGGRLPTAEEWSFAALGETGARYPWGDGEVTPERACLQHGYTHEEWIDPWGIDDVTRREAFQEDWMEGLREVGERPDGASPFGVEEMAGLVAEFVAPPPEKQGWTTIAGQSWYSVPEQVDLSAVSSHRGRIRLNTVGFRVLTPLVS